MTKQKQESADSEDRFLLTNKLRGALREWERNADALVLDASEQAIDDLYTLGKILCNKTGLRRQAGLKRKKSGGRKRSHDLSPLLEHYDTLEAEFQAAKDWVRSRFPVWQKASTSWHKIVCDAYPALASVDDDLIERLSPSPELPEKTLDLIDKKDHDISKPSHIALEAAARLCGCSPYEYGTRHLLETKRQLKG